MVIVAGHITVEPQQRDSYLAGCVSVVELARGTAGCLDFAITDELIERRVSWPATRIEGGIFLRQDDGPFLP